MLTARSMLTIVLLAVGLFCTIAGSAVLWGAGGAVLAAGVDGLVLALAFGWEV